VLYLPIVTTLLLWPGGPRLEGSAWLVIAVSTVLKTSYALFLQRAYRSGDFSLVYPLVRGSAPLLATAGAVLFLGERPAVVGLVGCGAIVVSIFFLSHGERLWQRTATGEAPLRLQAVGNALLVGCIIASYTVWDRNAVGLHHIHPVLFDGMTNIGLTLLLCPFAWGRRHEVRHIWRVHRREVLTVATLSPLAYVLVLTALSFTPVSYVAPAREFSILVGAYLGARVLGESHNARRLVCAAVMVAGLIALALA
jgi:uncharacterized membrane protein